MNQQSNLYDAFISYSHRDRFWTEKLNQNLRNHGVKTFIDLDRNDTSKGVLPDLDGALKQARYLLLIASPDSMASLWVRSEIEAKQSQHSDQTPAILLANMVTTPLPRDCEIPDQNRFHFERPETNTTSSASYDQRYRDEFTRLCRRLGSRSRRTVEVAMPAEHLPRGIYKPLLDILEHVLAWPATRRGICVHLGLNFSTLDWERDNRLAANLLVQSLSQQRQCSRPYTCRMLLHEVMKSCSLDEARMRACEQILYELDYVLSHNVDDEFVERVRAAVGPRYETKAILGGSSTIVVEAVDATLDRKVIIKVLRPNLAGGASDDRSKSAESNGNADHETDPPPEEETVESKTASNDSFHRVRDAFRRYVKMAARVEHPTFPVIHGARFDADVNLCISDYSEGVSLASLIRSEFQLGLDAIIQILEQVAAALDYLEGSPGECYVHTYLNPENIFVDETCEVRISPFGIVERGDRITPLPVLYARAGHPMQRARMYCLPVCEGEQYSAHEGAHQFGLAIIASELIGGTPIAVDGCSLGSVELVHNAALAALSGGIAKAASKTQTEAVIGRMFESRYAGAKSAIRMLISALRKDARSRALTGNRRKNVGDLIDKISKSADKRVDAGCKVAQSLSAVMSEDFLAEFQERFHNDPRVKSVFAAHWSKLKDTEGIDDEKIQKHYKNSLRRALTTIVNYGQYPAYESLELEKIAESHRDNYRVPVGLYDVFKTALLETLRSWDPPFGVAQEDAENCEEAWDLLLKRVIDYVSEKR